MSSPVPVTLLTGFLGSGKTTLLNRFLKEGALKEAALIVNEFGDVGIDHLLVETADEGIVELSDGCLCCTIRGDLIDTLTRLLDQRGDDGTAASFKRIVIESTGLADPVPILQAVIGHPFLVSQLRLERVITTLDGVNADATLDAHVEAVRQVALADALVLTKGDIAAVSDALLQRLGQLNPEATISHSRSENFDPHSLFEMFHSAAGVAAGDISAHQNPSQVHARHDHDKSRHDAGIKAFTLLSDKFVDQVTLASFIDVLRSLHGPDLLRVKGIIGIKDTPDKPVVIHGVQQVFAPPIGLDAWPSDDRHTRVVVIGKGLPEDSIRKLFDAFTGNVAPDTPDRLALEQNPLAVPGYSGTF